MPENPQPLSHNDYTVGWICALPKSELVVAGGMLDEEHPMLFAADSQDTNSYLLGRIGSHNVVIACLPAEKTGTVSAAVVAKDMLRSFKGVRFGLMVGIGGGAPHYKREENKTTDDDDSEEEDDEDPDEENTRDIRLGDVVVSLPSKASQAVVQYDFGKSMQGGKFIRTSTLNNPPNIILNAVSQLQGTHVRKGHKLLDHLSKMASANPNLPQTFKHPGFDKDRLFKSDIIHIEGKKSCKACCGPLNENLVKRFPRESASPVLHYGTIGSADQVMKDSILRDKWAMDEDILCFEMEAAGLMDSFPCLVIRGICDYADSHKNKIWQPYAAATAAAYAKELLHVIPGQAVQNMPLIEFGAALLDKATQIIETIKEQTYKQECRLMSDKQRACHQVFKLSSYEEFKNNNPDRVSGTCLWVLQHPNFMQWLESQNNNLLWISADPGCGKSVLARSLVEKELQSTNSSSTCYFFFKDNEQQDSLAIALCALLHQLFNKQPHLLKHAVTTFETNGDKLQNEVGELWRALVSAATDSDSHDVICVLDALDECRERDRQTLLGFLSKFYGESSRTSRKSSLKFLITSRPYNDIESGFQNLPTIRLSGEKENDKIHEEIDMVIRQRVAELATKNRLSPLKVKELEHWLLRMQHRTYLWLHLAIKSIEEKFSNSLRPNVESIESLRLPSSINDAYEKILGNIKHENKKTVTLVLHIIVGARRPLSIDEMAIALGLATQPNSRSYAEVRIDKKRLKELLRRLCGLFVFINHSRIYLIHQTAKEFLVQKESRPKEPLMQKEDQVKSDFWKHRLRPDESELIMANICVNYLSLNELDSIKLKEIEGKTKYSKPKRFELQRVPYEEDNNGTSEVGGFLEYSAEHWPSHFRSAPINAKSSDLTKVFRLYQSKSNRFQLWFPLLWQVQRPYVDPPEMNDVRLAAFNGHDAVLSRLLSNKSINLEAKDNEGRTAFIWAAELGHKKVVKILLDKQTDVNAQGGEYGNALQAASYGGHKTIVKLLLENGADVNAQGGCFGNALQAALSVGHEAIVKLLLDKGADVNAHGRVFSNALQAASSEGNKAAVKLLLSQGADVNDRCGEFGSALQAASTGGHDEVVKLLLDHGAEVDAQGGHFGSALQAASSEGREAVVKLLLENGAEVNAQGLYFGNAIQAASYGGHEAIVKLLLKKGANFNAQGGYFGNALQAASSRGHEAVVKLLLDQGADVNIQCGVFSNALQAASSGGHEATVMLLLNKGANVNIQCKYYGNALQAASFNGHRDIVQLLLLHGAKTSLLHKNFLTENLMQSCNNIDTKMEILLNCGAKVRSFYEDVQKGNFSAVRLALESGMEIDVPGGYFQSALHTAAAKGHVEICTLLLEKSSTILDVKDHQGRTPLWLAAYGGHAICIEKLFTYGILDPNARSFSGRTPLWWASGCGHLTVVQLLLEKGANPNISDTCGVTPLTKAAREGHILIVETLKKYKSC